MHNVWDLLYLTHWSRITQICVSKQTIIASDNGWLPMRRQAIIWYYAGILLIGPLGTNFNEFLIEIYIFWFKKMCLKTSSAKWPFCLGLNELNTPFTSMIHDMSPNNTRDNTTAHLIHGIYSMLTSVGKYKGFSLILCSNMPGSVVTNFRLLVCRGWHTQKLYQNVDSLYSSISFTMRFFVCIGYIDNRKQKKIYFVMCIIRIGKFNKII